ncbi:VOC family protein [Actinocorallia longicatena]|uniref:VOC family protein n=1 Tax=Actinocorallia longicatena TaxID=111803 RepID=A0ABP6QJ62_9ACTN
MFRGFATVNIWADDVEAARSWYAELFGVEAYFERPGPDGRVAYCEFRIGDHQAEFGIVSRAFAPEGMAAEAGGAVVHWHVDDLTGTLERLQELGAKEYMPRIERGPGFVTAAVVDPFGNVLGVMHNEHYLRIVNGETD